MKLRKSRLMTAAALCTAALISSTMLGAVNPDAVPALLAAEEEAAAWTLDADGTLTISGNIYDSEVPWKEQAEQIKKVVIEPGNPNLPSYPFDGCVNLTSATIGEGAYDVRGGMFKGCTALTEVSIPASATSIGYNAFEGCTALTEFTVPETVHSISDNAFKDCTGLKSVTITEDTYGLGSYAFSGCTSLTEVNVLGELNVVGHHVFENTPWLKAQQEKNPLVIVNNYLVDGTTCSGDVVLPDGLIGMGGAFMDCTALTSVQIPESVYNINTYAFMNCTGLTEVKLPSELDTLSNYAFAGCTGLTHIEIPDTVTNFNNCVFQGCTNLKSVKLSNQIWKLGDGVFKDCVSLESIELPDSIWHIYGGAFENCTSLKEVTIPQYVQDVESLAFKGCTNLETITVKNPLCAFSIQVFPETLRTLVGYEGSTAQLAAEKEGFAFENLGVFIDCPLGDYFHISRSVLMFKPGSTIELREIDRYKLFCVGAKIAEAEVEIENLDELSLTQDELSTEIEDSTIYKLTNRYYGYSRDEQPVSIVHINAKLTVQETIKNRNEEIRFAFTKLIDEDGNDLLADVPDHKIVSTYAVMLYTPSKPTPTEPTEPATEPTEPATEPTEPATDPTEPATEPTEPATDPTEPATDPTGRLLGDVNGDGKVNATDAAQVLIAAANIGASKPSGLIAAAETAADVNCDSKINATDAAIILQYAAYIGAGNAEMPLEDYIAKIQTK